MKPILKKADASGLPCYLETMKEKNLPFYQKHGFSVMAEGSIPKGGPYTWAMLRPATK